MRENNVVENYKDLIENRNRLAEIHENAENEKRARRQKFVNEYHNILESREMRQRRHGQLMESCRDDAFGKAIKAIYITALESSTLTDNGVTLAESMVDTWIKENGGASTILGKCQNNTYLLARISQIVEEAAIIETEEIEKIDDDKIDTEEETKDVEKTDATDANSNDDEVFIATKVIEKNLDMNDKDVINALEIIKKKANKSEEKEKDESDKKDTKQEDTDELDKNDGKSEDADDENGKSEEKEDKNPLNDTFDDEDELDEEDDEESKSENDNDKEESNNKNPLNDTFDEDDESEENEETNETDVADDIVDDLEEAPEDDITIDGDNSNNGKVFDELEKEDDVKKAIEVIRQRVADAEETFIKRNAADKKAIDNLIGKISDNVKTVEDLNDANNPKSEVAEESARLYKQKINDITEFRPLSVLEKMTRIIHSNVVKNQVVRENYSNENGSLDVALIVEAAKVMYGFFETVNTLQLEKVDTKYIENVIKKMQ